MRGSKETSTKGHCSRTREDDPEPGWDGGSRDGEKATDVLVSMSPQITVHLFHIDIGVNKNVACQCK